VTIWTSQEFLPPLFSILISQDGSVWIQGPHAALDSTTVTVLDGVDFSVLGWTTN